MRDESSQIPGWFVGVGMPLLCSAHSRMIAADSTRFHVARFQRKDELTAVHVGDEPAHQIAHISHNSPPGKGPGERGVSRQFEENAACQRGAILAPMGHSVKDTTHTLCTLTGCLVIPGLSRRQPVVAEFLVTSVRI